MCILTELCSPYDFLHHASEEHLDADNMWYCSHCKGHVRAMKTVALWRLPNVLIIHLKRFEYGNSFRRDKIGILVDFPITGFDLKPFVSATTCSQANIETSGHPAELIVDETPLIYDLFGVTNHYGRMGFGHYTAYARRWSESGIENLWSEFDDENIVELDAGDGSVVSAAAYVLFYRRRVIF